GADRGFGEAADKGRAPGGKFTIADGPQQYRLEHGAIEADRDVRQISHRANYLGHGDPVQRLPYAGGITDTRIAVDAPPKQFFGDRFGKHDRDIEMRLIGEKVVRANEPVLRPGAYSAPHTFQRQGEIPDVLHHVDGIGEVEAAVLVQLLHGNGQDLGCSAALL